MNDVVFDRDGESGNIFCIMGKAYKVLEVSGRSEDARAMVTRVQKSGSYEEALKIIGEYVKLVEV